ncbi:MAG: cupin domain-containing protein, partial [Dehalococcoidia bacterium]|nr:cupin domain-containing protein [Dehalococcoidia bacterium]
SKDKNTKKKEEKTNLFEELFALRDRQRERWKSAPKVIKFKEIPLEKNRMGLYRWYLHPGMDNTAINTILLWQQEIPPSGKSGKQKTSGGRLHYVLQGRGYTIVDGVKHEWEQGDLVIIPKKPQGAVHQHFNSDPEVVARLACTEPNWTDSLGVDTGVALEQLENAAE